MQLIVPRQAGRPFLAALVPPRTDAALAGFFLLVGLAEALLGGTRPTVPQTLVTAVAMAALAWRRRFPMVVAALVVVTNIAVNPSDQFTLVFAVMLVSFTLGNDCPRPRSYAGLAVVCVPFLGAMLARGLVPSDLAAALLFVVCPWVVGDVTRQRAAQADAAVVRAEQLERTHRAEAELAAERERTRIARELHDIVSHSISVVAIQTQAVRRQLRPEQAAEAADLAAVETTAREALAEMRRLLGVLRADGDGPMLAPQPGLADLARLLETFRTAGVEVSLRLVGEQFPVPAGADLAAYRIIQEGVTNALRHAPASPVEVTLDYRSTALRITVRDRGPGMAPGPDAGHGLAGVRERVELYGGTLQVTSTPSGVTLTASIPVRSLPA